MADGTPNPVSGTDGAVAAGGGIGSKEFWKPRLTGARFEGHAIPLEFLKDLAVLEEMVIEVAKWRFLQANPGRKRSPRGFTDGVALKLTGVEEGSAIPVISLAMATATLFPPEHKIYFEEARQAIVSAIGAAEQNGTILDHLPETALSYFDRMGRSLRDGEAIEFSNTPPAAPARLTRETRRQLVLASSRVQELTEDTVTRGAVPEADQEKMTFTIQLPDGRRISAPLTEPHTAEILAAFYGYKSGVRILLQGIGRFNRTNRLVRFDSIEHASALDPLDVAARLDELRILKDGWFEGHGIAPAPAGLDWLSAAFEQHFPENLRLPFLYPTFEGGVRAEWTLQDTEASIEIDLAKQTGVWHSLRMATDKEETRAVNLDNADDWTWLVGRIRTIGGGAA